MTIPSPSVPSQDQNLTITWPSPTFSNICHRIFKALNGALLCHKYAMVGLSVWICHLQCTWMNCWDCLKNMLCPEKVFTRPSRSGLFRTQGRFFDQLRNHFVILSSGQSWRWQLCGVLFRVPRLPSPDKTQTQVPSLDNESALKNTVTVLARWQILNLISSVQGPV